MSNVFRRFHKPTGIEYFDNGAALGVELYRVLTHEKIVPKSRRFIYTIPIFNIYQREWMWIGLAFDTYPAGNDAQALLEKKKKAFQNAIDANEAIIRALQQMVITHKEIDIDRLNNLGELLVKESNLLRKAKDSSRIQQESAKGRKPSGQ